jgi:hypothetical protein
LVVKTDEHRLAAHGVQHHVALLAPDVGLFHRGAMSSRGDPLADAEHGRRHAGDELLVDSAGKTTR